MEFLAPKSVTEFKKFISSRKKREIKRRKRKKKERKYGQAPGIMLPFSIIGKVI